MAVARFNKFYGGFSPSDGLATESQILWAENMSIRKEPYYAQLSIAPTQVVTTNAKDINCFVQVRNTSTQATKVVGFGESGVIYNSDATDDTPSYTLSSGLDIRSAVVFNGTLYFTADNGTGNPVQLNKVTEANAYAGTYSTNVTENFKPTGVTNFDNGISSEVYPLLNYLDVVLYIAIGNKIVAMDTSEAEIDNYTFVAGNITAMTEIGGQIKVYTDKGEQAFWDGSSSTATSVVRWNDPIHYAVSAGGFDYVITGKGWTASLGDSAALWMTSGYDKKLISRVRRSEQLGDNIFDIERIATYGDGQLYIEQQSGDGVYSYGTELQELPTGYNLIATKNSLNEAFSSITGLGYFNGELYIGQNSSSGHAIEKIDRREVNPTSFQAAGTMYTPFFDANARTLRKSIRQVEILVKDTTASNTIVLKYSTDEGSYATIGTVNTNTTSPTRFRYYAESDGTALQDFYNLSFEVEFVYSSGTESPKLYEIAVTYDVID